MKENCMVLQDLDIAKQTIIQAAHEVYLPGTQGSLPCPALMQNFWRSNIMKEEKYEFAIRGIHNI